jgi:hypothetical protein
MLDLARGCSFGSPFWILTSPPESEYLPTWKRFLDFSGRTTGLPLLPQVDAVFCLPDRNPKSEIVGSVWSDGHEVMAAAMDRRTEGPVQEITLGIRFPKMVSPDVTWRLSRLSSLNVEMPESGWKVDRVQDGVLPISGPLGPGEMILVETGGQ